MNLRSAGVDETQRLAELLGQVCTDGTVIALSGDLGAGKTAFVQGLARGLSVPAERRVTSPTFAIAHRYAGRLELHHLDFYRVSDPGELYELGIGELIGEAGVTAVEWPELCPELLGADCLAIRITAEDDRRELEVRSSGPHSAGLLAAWRERIDRGS